VLIDLLSDHEILQYQEHPDWFVEDIIEVKPTSQQRDALRAIGEHPAVAVKSGHGTGKTAMEAWLIQWFLTMFPESRVPATAPTGHQLEDLLWPELRKWSAQSINAEDYDWTKTRFAIKGYADTWFAVPRSSNKPENMQGFHADHLLFVIDEASGVAQNVMEVVEGALTNDGAKLLMAGNPTILSGSFYNAFHRDAAFYVRFTFSSTESDNVSPAYADRIARKYGKESDVYRVRVEGKFPLGSPSQFIRLDLVEAAITQEVDPEGMVFIGVDPARFGDDESVVCHRKGNHVFPIEGFYQLDGPTLAGEVARIVKSYRAAGYEQTIQVRVDETGVGSSPVDFLRLLEQELNIIVIAFNFGGAGDDDYANAGTKIWADMKDRLSVLQLPDDADLVGQMTSRNYKVKPDGKVILESKDDMKKRGITSPDRADGLALCVADISPPKILPVKRKTKSSRRVMAGYRKESW